VDVYRFPGCLVSEGAPGWAMGRGGLRWATGGATGATLGGAGGPNPGAALAIRPSGPHREKVTRQGWILSEGAECQHLHA